jgi:hypothetical protein
VFVDAGATVGVRAMRLECGWPRRARSPGRGSGRDLSEADAPGAAIHVLAYAFVHPGTHPPALGRARRTSSRSPSASALCSPAVHDRTMGPARTSLLGALLALALAGAPAQPRPLDATGDDGDAPGAPAPGWPAGGGAPAPPPPPRLQVRRRGPGRAASGPARGRAGVGRGGRAAPPLSVSRPPPPAQFAPNESVHAFYYLCERPVGPVGWSSGEEGCQVARPAGRAAQERPRALLRRARACPHAAFRSPNPHKPIRSSRVRRPEDGRALHPLVPRGPAPLGRAAAGQLPDGCGGGVGGGPGALRGGGPGALRGAGDLGA